MGILRNFFSSKSKLGNIELVTSRVEGLRPKLEVDRTCDPLVVIMVPAYSAETVNILLDIIYTGQSRTTGKVNQETKRLEVVHLYKDLCIQPDCGLPELSDLDQIEVQQIKREYFEEDVKDIELIVDMEIESELDKQHSEVQETTEKLHDKVNELTAKLEEEKNLKKLLEDDYNKKFREIESQKIMEKEKNEQLEFEISDLKAKYDHEIADKEATRNLLKTIPKLESERNNLKAKYDEEIKEKIRIIEAQKTRKEENYQKLSDSTNKYNELMVNYDNLIKEHEMNKNLLETRLCQAIADKEKCEFESGERFKEINSQKIVEMDKNQKLRSLYHDLHSKYNAEMKEKEKFQAQYEHEVEKAASMYAEQKCQSLEIENLQQEMAVKENNWKELEIKLRQKISEKEEIQNQRKELEDELEEVKEKYERLVVIARSFKSKLISDHKEKCEFESCEKYVQLESEKREIESKSRELREEVMREKNQIVEKDLVIGNLLDKNKKLDLQVTNLESEIRRKNDIILDVKNQMDQIRNKAGPSVSNSSYPFFLSSYPNDARARYKSQFPKRRREDFQEENEDVNSIDVVKLKIYTHSFFSQLNGCKLSSFCILLLY